MGQDILISAIQRSYLTPDLVAAERSVQPAGR